MQCVLVPELHFRSQRVPWIGQIGYPDLLIELCKSQMRMFEWSKIRKRCVLKGNVADYSVNYINLCHYIILHVYVRIYEGTRIYFDLWRTRLDSLLCEWKHHYSDVIMGTMVSQINILTYVYSIVYSGVDQRKLQSSASSAFVRDRWIPCTNGQ